MEAGLEPEPRYRRDFCGDKWNRCGLEEVAGTVGRLEEENYT